MAFEELSIANEELAATEPAEVLQAQPAVEAETVEPERYDQNINPHSEAGIFMARAAERARKLKGVHHSGSTRLSNF